MKKNENKEVSVSEKSFGSDTDTEMGPWFWFLIPKPGFGRTLSSKGGFISESFSLQKNVPNH